MQCRLNTLHLIYKRIILLDIDSFVATTQLLICQNDSVSTLNSTFVVLLVGWGRAARSGMK